MGLRTPAWNHLLNVEPGITQHYANILFLIQIDYISFRKKVKTSEKVEKEGEILNAYLHISCNIYYAKCVNTHILHF